MILLNTDFESLKNNVIAKDLELDKQIKSAEIISNDNEKSVSAMISNETSRAKLVDGKFLLDVSTIFPIPGTKLEHTDISAQQK